MNGWTLYGEVGRQPAGAVRKIDSYEYWVALPAQKGLGFRVGRFLPAYGVRLADHTAFTRGRLGFDKYDQVYALEVSHTASATCSQVSLGPGRADAILHDDGRHAFTATGRFQMDLSSRTVLVVSASTATRRASSRRTARLASPSGSPRPAPQHLDRGGRAVPAGSSGAPAYTLLNETGVEVFRGLWLKFSPQLRTESGDTSAGILPAGLRSRPAAADALERRRVVLPRTRRAAPASSTSP